MRRQGYFSQFVFGPRLGIASYGLICLEVAFSVLSMFFIHWGLVKTKVITAFTLPHYALLAVVPGTQLVTLATLLRHNNKLLGHARVDAREAEREAVTV
jgi:hypothetical protein